MMDRRKALARLGALAIVPFSNALAQSGKQKRIGILLPWREGDKEGVARLAAFRQALLALGWREGANIVLDIRYSVGDQGKRKLLAGELVRSGADVLIGNGTEALALLRLTRDIPLIFNAVMDPVSIGLVASLAHPGGNATGITNFEFSTGAKWLQILREIAPSTSKLLILGDPSSRPNVAMTRSIRQAATSFKLLCVDVDVRSFGAGENSLGRNYSGPHIAMIVLPSSSSAFHRARIIRANNEARIIAIYPYKFFTAAGGLVSYGPDPSDQFRQVADYLNRILRGAKPAILPVQAPKTFELVVNLETAASLGIKFPQSLLVRSDTITAGRR